MERVGAGKDAARAGVPQMLSPAWHYTAPPLPAPHLGLQQQDFAGKGNCLHSGGVYRASQPCSSIAGGEEALKSPYLDQLGQLQPAPSPGRGTPVCACLSAGPEHSWEQPQRKPRCPGEMPARAGGCAGQKARLVQLHISGELEGAGGGWHAVACTSEPAPEARQASLLAVHEELFHQAGSAGTFLDLLFSV